MTKRRQASLRDSRHCYVAVEPVACASVAAARLLSSRLRGAATNWSAQRKVPSSSFKRCVTLAAHALQGRAQENEARSAWLLVNSTARSGMKRRIMSLHE
jgi:hypothetical protein